jgi:hypothetical protein
MQLASLESKAMLRNGMVAVAGAALVLGSFLVVADASAAGRKGNGGGNHAAPHRVSGQKQTNTRKPTTSSLTTPNGSGADFGFSGPFIGTKFIGNQ